MRPSRWLPLVWFLLSPFANATDCSNFGPGVTLLPDAKGLRGVKLIEFNGDYNGDRVVDRLVLLTLPPQPVFAKDVTVVTFGDQEKQRYPNDEIAAIGIILSPQTTSCKKYVIYDRNAFTLSKDYDDGITDIKGHLEIILLSKEEQKEDYFSLMKERIGPGLKFDAVSLYIPGGNTGVIYWNGKSFTIYIEPYTEGGDGEDEEELLNVKEK